LQKEQNEVVKGLLGKNVYREIAKDAGQPDWTERTLGRSGRVARQSERDDGTLSTGDLRPLRQSGRIYRSGYPGRPENPARKIQGGAGNRFDASTVGGVRTAELGHGESNAVAIVAVRTE
jgi:hypothetical protein